MMMKTLKRPCFLIALAAPLLSGQLIAQTAFIANDESESTAASRDGQDAPPSTAQTSGNTTQPAKEYVPSLDGGGMISMSGNQRVHLLAGGTFTGGLDTNPTNAGSSSAAALYSVSPYLSMQASSNRIQYLMQYQPTITFQSGYAGQTIHIASMRLVGNATQRLTWTFALAGTHGSDSLRLLSPAQTTSIGGVPGTGPTSASYRANAGTVTDVDGAVTFRYDLSPRNFATVYVENNFDSVPNLNERNSVATLNLNYTHRVSPTLSTLGYTQSSQYYGGLSCTTFGGGAGFEWQPKESTYFSFKGGPQLNAPICKNQQGFAYNTYFTVKLPQRSQFYVSAARQAVTGFLGPGLWEDDFSTGYRRLVKNTNTLLFDVGFVNSTTLTKIGSYRGLYFDGSYTHVIHRGISAGLSFRNYTGDSGSTSFSRNLMILSLTWTPNVRPLFQ